MKDRLCIGFIIGSIIMTGCSFGALSMNNAVDIALDYTEAYIEESSLDISIDDVRIFEVVRNDHLKKWDVYLEVDSENSEITLSPISWVSISDEKEIVEYYLWEE
jgi:hypothetical protein